MKHTLERAHTPQKAVWAGNGLALLRRADNSAGSASQHAEHPAGEYLKQDIKYWAHGPLYQMKLGTALTEQWT